MVLNSHSRTIQVDAYIFLSGSCGSLSTTVAFLYVLWRFPRFIKHVKAEGADPTVVVRLATFYQLNVSFFRGYCVVQDGLLMSRADIACPSRVPVLVHSAVVDARGRWNSWEEASIELELVGSFALRSRRLCLLMGMHRASTGMGSWSKVRDDLRR